MPYCIQDELRFCVSPELIAGMLFVESLAPNESLEVIGIRRYSRVSGWGTDFKFIGSIEVGFFV